MNAFERIRETTIVERLRLSYGSVIDIIKVDGSKRTINSQNLLGCALDASGNVIGTTGLTGSTIYAPTVLDQSAVAVSHTGDAVEFTLKRVVVPARAIGPNGYVRAFAVYSGTNTANNKNYRIRFANNAILSAGLANLATYVTQIFLFNRNATNSQVATPNNFGGSFSSTAQTLVTMAVDTTVDQNLDFNGQLSNTGETISLEAYCVEVMYRA